MNQEDDDAVAPLQRTPALGGLRLPVSLGTSSTVKAQVHQAWDTLTAIEADLSSKGLDTMAQPNAPYPGPVTPDQLTTNDNQSYSTLYAVHLGWYNFTAELLARARSVLLQVENEMTDISSRRRIDERVKNKVKGKDDKLSKDGIEDTLTQEPRYMELKVQQQRYQQYKFLLEAKLEGMYRNLQVLSRQVTIRGMEIDQHHIASNLPTRGAQRGIRG